MRVPAGEVPGLGPGVAASAGQGDDPIDYSVEPDVVECSRPDGPPRTVTLTVHAKSDSAELVACRRISLAITLGEGETALTVDPATIRPVPGHTTPWYMGVSGEGRWDCVPLPPATGLGSRQRASFALSRIATASVVRVAARRLAGSVRMRSDDIFFASWGQGPRADLWPRVSGSLGKPHFMR
jgi:hypothetical protein